jgi:hypothetical protein
MSAYEWRKKDLPAYAGQVFKTGEKSPVAGHYAFFRLEDETVKAPVLDNKARYIALEEGEEIPPAPGGQSARWQLARILYAKMEAQAS